VAPVRREWLVDASRDIVAALASGTVRTTALIAAQSTQARLAIDAAVVEATAPYGGGDARRRWDQPPQEQITEHSRQTHDIIVSNVK